ncbi:MAG: polysulfide reductase NrfD [Candidatus Heimdallarchaeota archaeon]|nr:polysulfide reductase NrfD [Candidatus Heimdallarchaeota archaeon]MDH5645782.1 polysulfide reductase NrfD [Candidatus Heimdallarchaeota archaeon]
MEVESIKNSKSYGFVIDNRKCIGCHACTIACKAEHDVPIGVFRTWVKYIEKGVYPDTRRLFSVMRCNHCEDAPCVNICPVTALYTRADGIVDFDGTRCIACKSCMQACPYDALYIDPNTQTAAKCNYCSNRIELGLQPACVVVCPEQAIISGDINNPETEISKLLARQTVSVRKQEKGTSPKVFYIEGDTVMLTPMAVPKQKNYMWSSQSEGVGHYAEHHYESSLKDHYETNVKRTYDVPDKGRLWGWQVPSYLFTKSIGAGLGLLLSMLVLMNLQISSEIGLSIGIIGMVSILATVSFLVLDLDQPKRFYTVLLRPQMKSWLTRGAYILVFYSLLLFIVTIISALTDPVEISIFITILVLVFAFLSAVYTAFLFAQAKGRDFWQSPILPFDMLVHSLLSGSSVLLLLNEFGIPLSTATDSFVKMIFYISAYSSVLFALMEVYVTHPTEDAHRTSKEIKEGKWSKSFWSSVIGLMILPIALTFNIVLLNIIAFVLTLYCIFTILRIWVYAPQDIALV